MMKFDEIIKGMERCKTGECGSCPYYSREECDTDLLGDALNYIMALNEKASADASIIHKLNLGKETLEEMLEQKYTKKQLVQAVNDIFDDTEIKDLNSTAQSVGEFLRLIDADGYMAVLPGGTVEIRLNEE